MDILTQIYGEQQKTAAFDNFVAAEAEALEKIAQENGIDLSQLSKEEIAALYAQLKALMAQQEAAPATEGEPAKESAWLEAEMDAFAKIAAANGVDVGELTESQAAGLYQYYLGEVEKQAAYEQYLESPEGQQAVLNGQIAARTFLEEVKEAGPKLDAVKAAPKALGEGFRTLGSMIRHPAYAAKQMSAAGRQMRVGGATRMQVAKQLADPGTIAAAGLTSAGLAGAGYGAKKLMDKKSALEDMAMARAEEILKVAMEGKTKAAIGGALLGPWGAALGADEGRGAAAAGGSFMGGGLGALGGAAGGAGLGALAGRLAGRGRTLPGTLIGTGLGFLGGGMGGSAYGAAKAHEKNSALDNVEQLINERAIEILAENGYTFE